MEHIVKISNGIKTKVIDVNKEVPNILLYRRNDINKNEKCLEFKQFPPDLKKLYNLFIILLYIIKILPLVFFGLLWYLWTFIYVFCCKSL